MNETHAEILLTSSHKSSFTLGEWKKIFNLRGITQTSIGRLPENTYNLNRKAEVEHWISVNALKHDFVIIDDDKSLNDLPRALKSKLVLTSGMIGLTAELADEAIAILKMHSVLAD